MPDSKRTASIGDIPQTLVGGGPVTTAILEIALRYAPRLIAVDSGADAILSEGKVPDRVVGDLDSISDRALEAFADVLCLISEQDSTDFAKALRTCPSPLTIAVGFIGARADHFLSVLTEMARTRAPVVLLGEEECICVLPPDLTLDLVAGTRVSLWPLGPASGVSSGLRWPIDGIDFDPATRTGTSNEATGAVTLTMRGDMVLLLPAAELPKLLSAMQSPPRGAGVVEV
ncbi:thiamine diphosphokinase [Jannaschia faecimaris]|uniref:Thiamine diphosphokinase n=1 Tax=Jannaschia faecimaris TaxID=1244108 RepID=A0A1H3N3V6_9RHOB|nr:thiamine diphosphokinase [Jannaschia faecimaris]SDY83423.1 thiamine diphosphokinase [Jannaschia faecimaris]